MSEPEVARELAYQLRAAAVELRGGGNSRLLERSANELEEYATLQERAVDELARAYYAHTEDSKTSSRNRAAALLQLSHMINRSRDDD